MSTSQEPSDNLEVSPMMIRGEGRVLLRLTAEGKLLLPEDSDPSEAAKLFVRDVEHLLAEHFVPRTRLRAVGWWADQRIYVIKDES